MAEPREICIRRARLEDSPSLFALVEALAAYEHLSDEVKASPQDLERALFRPQPKLFCELAERAGKILGMAIWFYSFSTFAGRHGIFVEDLFVLEGFRGQGIGRALLKRLAQICDEENLARLEWAVLDWNQPSIGFYKAIGARMMVDWTNCRLEGEALKQLADP